MPSWILACQSCHVAFEHTKVDDYTLLNFLDPSKPKIPAAGIEIACPNCGVGGMYLRSDLFYRK
jgi:uncharacterized protein (DUF983 family)